MRYDHFSGNHRKHTKPDDRGRYDHEGDWNRLCCCGHTLGVHCAGSPADCLLHSFAGYTEERPPLTMAEINAAAERILVTRDRAKYNAYHRDYKKAKPLGLTVAQYRAREKT